MIGWPAARACFVLCACWDSQQPTWPQAVQTRRLKSDPHSWHRSPSGAWTVPSKWGQLAPADISARELDDRERRALRIGGRREAADAGDLHRLFQQLAAQLLDAGGGLVGVGDAEVDAPE